MEDFKESKERFYNIFNQLTFNDFFLFKIGFQILTYLMIILIKDENDIEFDKLKEKLEVNYFPPYYDDDPKRVDDFEEIKNVIIKDLITFHKENKILNLNFEKINEKIDSFIKEFRRKKFNLYES